MAKLTAVETRNHAKQIVDLVADAVTNWISCGAEEGQLHALAEKKVTAYLSKNNLLDADIQTIVEQAIKGLFKYNDWSDFPSRVMTKETERLVYAKLFEY